MRNFLPFEVKEAFEKGCGWMMTAFFMLLFGLVVIGGYTLIAKWIIFVWSL